MKRFRLYGVAAALAAGFVALPMFLNAQDVQPQQQDDAAQVADGEGAADNISVADLTLADLLSILATPADVIPPEMQDPVFQKYVDISLLSEAWTDLDPVLMTDVALQLQEGERILRRSHVAVSSKDLLKTAAKIAGESNDEATLARIKAAAESTGDKELAGEVALAAKLGGSARDMTPDLQIPLGTLEAEDYADLQGFMQTVRAARLAGDAEVLQSLSEEVANLKGLSQQQRETLTKSISESLEMVKQAGKIDPTVEALEKIRGASRDFISHFGGFHGHFSGGRGHFGGRFGGRGGRFGSGRFGRFGRSGRFGGGRFGGRFGGRGGSGFGGRGGSRFGGRGGRP